MSWNDPGPVYIDPNSQVTISGPGTYRGTILSSRLWRLIAFVIDLIPVALLNWAGNRGGAVWGDFTAVLALAWIVFDFVWLQGMKAWSVGKLLLGIRIAQPIIVPDRGAVLTYMGVGPALLYAVGRLLDWFAFIGLIVGLVRTDRRTFAELFSGTIVIRRSTMPQLEHKPAQYVRDSKHYS